MAAKRAMFDRETGQIVPRSEEIFVGTKITWRALEGYGVLTLAEERVLHVCMSYVQYGSNAIWDRKPLTISDIANRCTMDRSDVSRCVNGLIRKNCLLFEKAGELSAYYLNPAIVRCGTKAQLNSVAHRFDKQRQDYVAQGDETVRWSRRTVPITFGKRRAEHG